jgi:DNA-binding transcriptional regulator YiaG
MHRWLINAAVRWPGLAVHTKVGRLVEVPVRREHSGDVNATQLRNLMRLRRLLRSGMATALRDNAGLSLRQAAEAVGISATTLSRWERNQRRPSADAGLRYLDVLDELIGRLDD